MQLIDAQFKSNYINSKFKITFFIFGNGKISYKNGSSQKIFKNC